MNALAVDSDTPVGLIGLGHIGCALTTRLLAAGQSVMGFRRGDTSGFVALGGVAAPTIEALVDRCPTILLALPDGATSLAVVQDIIGHAKTPVTIVDLTSMAARQTQAAFASASAAGHAYVEAPISGSADAVREHKATLVVGGDTGALNTLRPLLEIIAARIVPTGAPGSASIVKSAALMLIGIHTHAVAEALAFVESQGVSPDRMLEALADGPAGSGALAHRGQLMASRQYAPTIGRLDGLVHLLTAIRVSAVTPVDLLDTALAAFSRAGEEGFGGADPAAVYELMRPR
ncbi:NAD(P)-dependent oxidoreductase [Sphingobium chungangianum]